MSTLLPDCALPEDKPRVDDQRRLSSEVFCESTNHVLASRGSQKGTILEHWSSLRSLRDYLEQTCQESSPSTLAAKAARSPPSPLAPSPAHGARLLPEGCPFLPARDRTPRGPGRPVHRPHGRAWLSEPASERGVGRPEVSPVCASGD